MLDQTIVIDQFSQGAETYDERNRKLSDLSCAMHFLIKLVLQGVPTRARVLCVGVGTGADILSLAVDHPHWEFVGVDPSSAMLAVCRKRLGEAGILNRCTLIEGYVQEVPRDTPFDAVVSILVAHFIARENRLAFYRSLWERVSPGGLMVCTDLSFDLSSPEFSFMLKNWESVQSLLGASEESLRNLPTILRDSLSIISPEETAALLTVAGVRTPVHFFQAFLMSGWYGVKDA